MILVSMENHGPSSTCSYLPRVCRHDEWGLLLGFLDSNVESNCSEAEEGSGSCGGLVVECAAQCLGELVI
ncbi:hypothetical protein ROHU_017328 [Labeo rohita]|uniref:Uncharacterized protein n=1 Tax=Labeo rohita TaxID=84645 RepID=A0A498NGV5_LABRO|nr:hypothetical protein ROHU_017328 [Labeo rohita]